MKLFLAALSLLAGSTAAFSSASAYVIFEVTDCDTVSVEPPRYRTTFTASPFAGPGFSEVLVRAVLPVPASGDTTRILACGPPEGWNCESYPGSEGILFWWTPGGPYGSTPAFWVETDRAVPCLEVIFINPVEVVGWITSCLHCDMPVPARRASWGSVKSLYR